MKHTDWPKPIRPNFAETVSGSDQIIVRRRALERAWATMGFSAMCGTLGATKVGEILQPIEGIVKYSKGEIVLFTAEGSGTVTVEKPNEPSRHGSHGFIATSGTMVCVPEHLVAAIDPRTLQANA